MKLGQLRPLGRLFLLILGGEVLQSAFHFAFNIALVRLLPAWDYGLFAIIMLIGGLALTYMRSLAGMPASLFLPVHRDRPRSAAFEVTFGSGALVVSIVVGLGVAAGLSPWLGTGALLAGSFVALWSLRSFLRTMLLARKRQIRSAVSDVCFTTSGAVLALLLLRGHDQGLLDRAFLVLTLANAVGIGVALELPRRALRVSFGRGTRRRYAAMASQLAWSSAGVTTANMQAQGQVLLIAALVGPAAYAPIAATLVFYAPLRLAASALANMMQPELAAHMARGDGAKIRHLLMIWTAGMLLVGLCCGLATLVALPLFDAPVFAGQPKLLIGLLACAVSMMPLLYVMPKILLEVQRAFRTIAVMTSVSGVVGMSIVAALLATAGPAWSLLGSLVSEAMILLWCWLAVAPGSPAAAEPRFRAPASTGQPA